MHANWNGLPGFKGIVGKTMDAYVANTTFQYPEEFVSVYPNAPNASRFIRLQTTIQVKEQEYQSFYARCCFYKQYILG